MTFTKEQWATSGNILVSNPNYIATRDSAKEAALYDRESREQHKLRVIYKRGDEYKLWGIGMPAEQVLHLRECYFTVQVIGTQIILSSGAKI